MLEVINGKNAQPINGTDRPTYLEAIVGIMTRPEWRILTFPASTLAASTLGNHGNPTSRSHTSLESAGSDFILESIQHNIRNIFSQNLLSQIGFCIDRMSMRHTPASVVTFSAKTCAYATFFCPGVADVLVRLWKVRPDGLRRVLAGFEMSTSSNIRIQESEDISSNFPPAVRSLSFTSHAETVRCLRREVPPPLSTSQINWFGPWVSRWSGRDTDLFFIFVKHFHILAAEFLPPKTPASKRVYAPGLIMVHAQMLKILENTLQKSTPGPMDSLQGATTPTFDDLIDGADASAAAMPLGSANSLRAMSENRLIVLVRDVIMDPTIEPQVKLLFVELFCAILKAVTKKTSLFDHNACFVLLDFVEDVASIISAYCQTINQPDLLDWDFWLDVCQQMMQSNNSLTEVRVFAFIFAVWDAINGTNDTRERLCLGILLHESVFYKYFSHWSSMVRAYFHRLLCWRLARYDGDPKLDT